MTDPTNTIDPAGQVVAETCIDLGPGTTDDSGAVIPPPLTAAVLNAVSALIPPPVTAVNADGQANA